MSNSNERVSIAHRIFALFCIGQLPQEVEVNDIDDAHTSIMRFFRKWGVSNSIGISKDPNKNSLWFYKRK